MWEFTQNLRLRLWKSVIANRFSAGHYPGRWRSAWSVAVAGVNTGIWLSLLRRCSHQWRHRSQCVTLFRFLDWSGESSSSTWINILERIRSRRCGAPHCKDPHASRLLALRRPQRHCCCHSQRTCSVQWRHSSNMSAERKRKGSKEPTVLGVGVGSSRCASPFLFRKFWFFSYSLGRFFRRRTHCFSGNSTGSTSQSYRAR